MDATSARAQSQKRLEVASSQIQFVSTKDVTDYLSHLDAMVGAARIELATPPV